MMGLPADSVTVVRQRQGPTEVKAGGRSCLIAVNRFYWPDQSATSQLLTDLAEHLKRCGGEVVIVTSRQRYDDPKAELPRLETHQDVVIRRVWTSRFGRHWLPGRALDYLSFYLSACVLLLQLARPGDTILAKTDPPLISVVAWGVARLRRAELVTWCQDLFPEVAAVLGLRWAAGPVGRCLSVLRNASLQGAKVNVVLCRRMAAHLVAVGVPAAHIVAVHNWADGAVVRPVAPERNRLRRAWALAGRRVIGYSGNLGRAHDLPAIQAFITAMLRADPSLVFLLIGGGAGMVALETWVKAQAITNVLFRPYQARAQLAESLSVPDCHLVSLAPACEGLIMPSKIYGILAAGRPLIALCDPNGAIAELIHEVDVGMVWRAGREREVLDLLGQSGDAAYRERIRRTFESRFDRPQALQRWEAVLHATRAGAAGAASEIREDVA